MVNTVPPINTRRLVEDTSALRVRIAKTERYAADLAADMRRVRGAR